MIYFDNAATGGFKPRAVTDTADNVMRYLSANPGRSGHRLSLTGARIVNETRASLSEMFFAPTDKVIFTKNCTEALNLAIFGTLKVGGHVITTIYEHNSVLRPLSALKNRGLIELDIVSPDKDGDIYSPIASAVKDNTYLIVSTAVSNVTGEVLPVKQIGALAKSNDIIYAVDGAQGGGHIDLSLTDNGISLLALAGHKGLYGIMGSGALLIEDRLNVEPLLFGGTGTESYNLSQPDCYPEKLEAGTLNLPAIAALNEGVNFVSKNMDNFSVHLKSATATLISELKTIKNTTVYSRPNPSGIVAFSIDGLPSTEVADILNSEYDVAVRGGLHCAPLMHGYLKTDGAGLVRASLAVQNSAREINFFLRAVDKIARR